MAIASKTFIGSKPISALSADHPPLDSSKRPEPYPTKRQSTTNGESSKLRAEGRSEAQISEERHPEPKKAKLKRSDWQCSSDASKARQVERKRTMRDIATLERAQLWAELGHDFDDKKNLLTLNNQLAKRERREKHTEKWQRHQELAQRLYRVCHGRV
jgi:hypothetical protein